MRFVGWFTPDESSGYREKPEEIDLDDVYENQGAVDDDVKEMLRICVHWVNMLPSDKIQDIKRSDDFVKFKKLLDKYGLLKKKD